jgi:transcriptional regulator with XRE-family HTH domain
MAAALRAQREALGLTQRELANQAGVSLSSVRFHERGLLPTEGRGTVLDKIVAVLYGAH